MKISTNFLSLRQLDDEFCECVAFLQTVQTNETKAAIQLNKQLNITSHF